MTKEQIMQRQQELVNNAKRENRDLTAEEQREFDTLQRSLEDMERSQGQSAAGEQVVERGLQNLAAGATQEGEAQSAQRAIEAERARVADITSLCRDFDMDPSDYIRNGSSLEAVRGAVIQQLQNTRGPINMRVSQDEGDKFRACASDALSMRAGMTITQPAEGAIELRGMSLRDLAVECMAREGQDVCELLRMGHDDMYSMLCRQFYNPTAAFPAILDDTIKKSIVHIYNQVPTTFQAWTTKGSLKDFKQTTDYEYVIGGTGDFLLVPENGELKADKPKTEKLPSRKLDTYGRQFSMSRQTFINDDIGFLTETPGLYAARAKKTIDKQVYKLLFENKNAFDDKALFHASHNNLISTGSKPSQASIQEIILQMQKQKDQFGEAIYITPQHIIVPVGYEFDLAVILHSTQVTGSNNNDINPLYNYPINVIQTPVLNALAGTNAAPWFMVANPMSARHIQVDYLNGQESPIMRRMESPGTLGFTWDIYLDWGVSIRDFRGIARNPGVVIG